MYLKNQKNQLTTITQSKKIPNSSERKKLIYKISGFHIYKFTSIRRHNGRKIPMFIKKYIYIYKILRSVQPCIWKKEKKKNFFKRPLMFLEEYFDIQNNTPWKVSASCQYLPIHFVSLFDNHKNTFRIFLGFRQADLKLIMEKNIQAQIANKI